MENNPLENWTKEKAKSIGKGLVEKEFVAESATEITLDGSNSVQFPGFPFLFTALGEKILVSLDQFKSGYECKTCKGAGKVKSTATGNLIICPSCEGKSVEKGGLIIPDTSKVLASSGVVVSMGALARERCKEYTLGDRILFGVHTGSMIPTKAGIMFKQMDWYQAWVKVDGAEELGAFDFIVVDDNKTNQL